jgi:ribosome recycling factor
MRPGVISILDDARGKLSAYAALLNYRFANLCVKAAPESLLPVMVVVGEETQNIENVAKVRLTPEREDQFEIFPLSPDFLMPIVKGIAEVHPEFKIDLVGFEGSDDPDDRIIVATMPVVDDTRHDILTEAVGVLSDTANAQIETTFTLFTARLAARLADADPEELDEAKDQLQQLHDKASDICKQYRADKEKEIEDAYQRFLAEKAEKEAVLQKAQEEAQNLQAGLQMKMTPGDD